MRNDTYANLVYLCKDAHKLITITNEDKIRAYIAKLKLNGKQLEKLNKYREKANMKPINMTI